MEFFTRACCSGQLSDADSDRVFAAYRERLAAIAHWLPGDLGHFVRSVSIHDALIRSFTMNQSSSAIQIGLRCGDRQVGYFDLDLFYGIASVTNCQLSELIAAVNSNDTEVLYDEVEAPSEGVFEHSFLLWPRGEFTILFRSFSMQRREVETRVLNIEGNRFRAY